MIFDTLICNYLLKKKFDNKHILALMSFYYLLIYLILYLFVFKDAFANQRIVIPYTVVTVSFFIYRISFIKKHIESVK